MSISLSLNRFESSLAMVFTNKDSISDESVVEGMAVTRVGKNSFRRFKANARERNRMHSLNEALDRLRNCIPITSISVATKTGKHPFNQYYS